MTDESAVPVEGDRERQHPVLPGGTFEFREGIGQIVYVARDSEDRRTTTFVAEVHGNAVDHARLLAGVSLTGSDRHSPYECAVEHRIQTISGEHLTDDNCRLCSLTGSGLDVERLKRVLRRLLENEDHEVFAILHAEAADEFAADIAEVYAALSGESGEPKETER